MTPDVPDPVVRPVVGGDRAAWQPLWEGYLTFYDEQVDPEVTDVVFQRLVDPGWPAQLGFVVAVEGELRGFAHVGVQPSTWSVAPDGYLEDLYVAAPSRGDGLGAALVEHLAVLGRDRGWRRLHWLTDTDNATARRLYDRIGERQDQVRYAIEL